MKSASEWYNSFNVLYNNITSNRAPGLSSYEISVFLTKAQNEIVRNYFDASSKGNNLGKGFDDSALRQMDFSTIIRSEELTPYTLLIPIINPDAIVYVLPKEMLCILNEEMFLRKETPDGKTVTETRQVIPLSMQEYTRLMSKPFKEPLKWQAWRLIANSNPIAEIILSSVDLKYPVKSYVLRYVRKPTPIILDDLTKYGDDITIEGYKGTEDGIDFTCELDASVHDAILQRAVELAKIAWEGDPNQTQSYIAAGQRSE